MGERLSTLLAALGTLLVVVILLSPGADPNRARSSPLSTDQDVAGLWALAEWARQSGAPVSQLRERYDSLGVSSNWPAKGNLLITVLPHLQPSQSIETDALTDWVYAGNQILIVAADADPAPWTKVGERKRRSRARTRLLDAFGIDFDAHRGDDSEDEEEDRPVAEVLEEGQQAIRRQTGYLEPITGTVLGQSLTRIQFSYTPATSRTGKLELDDEDEVAFAVLREAETGHAAFWEIPWGDGAIWLSQYATPFSNELIGEAGNAAFVAKLLTLGLGANGHIIFDDMHQGISTLYDPKAFFGDHKLWITCAFILGLWFAWVAGRAQRLGVPRPPARVLRAEDFARSVGGLFARRLTASATASALLEHFFEDLRRRYHVSTGQGPDWDLLDRLYPGSAEEVTKLHAFAQRLEAGERINLGKFTRHLVKVRGQLL